MTGIRIVHWTNASEKIVCCRQGEQVLYPSATRFDLEWDDPVKDLVRIGTRCNFNLDWKHIEASYPTHTPIESGNLSPAQELIAIRPKERIPFKPHIRGLKADIVLGVRQRAFAPEKNWSHWHELGRALRAEGLTYAVIGDRSTSFDIEGMQCHSADYDTDAAIELLQQCKCYLGTDSGGSHIAASVGADMVVFGYHNQQHRDLFPRMNEVNEGRVYEVADGWNSPKLVAKEVIARAGK
jgi:hypothetical protein